ncbi:MAG TPA: O-antigen ligase family protein, partial [Candidatus Binatus sp.]|nr:O-antigen ligase family protein [Candidatus Binatus sp.]
MRRQDWIIVAGVLIPAAFMPMAIGGTIVAACIAGEAIVCLMLLVWAVEMRNAPATDSAQVLEFGVPIIALVGYGFFQLAPLPPALLRVVSPASYQVYAKAFPDWPRESPYADINAIATATRKIAPRNDSVVVLPTLDEVKAGAPIPFAVGPDHSGSASTADTNTSAAESQGLLRSLVLEIYGTRWRPLTLSPPQTWGALLMLATTGGLFLLVGFFPVGAGNAEAEASFRRAIAIGLLAIGATVAIIGLVQQATWNGKILWSYVPLDWGSPGSLDSPRASGPFVNPDHFAGYLAAIFPLALSGALFPSAFVSGKWSVGARIVCASLAFMIFVAVLASQSRAGWISIAVATTLVAWLSMQSSATRGSQNGRAGYLRAARLALGILTAMLILATIFLGATGVSQTASRVHSTLSDVGNVAGRFDTWKAGLRIIRDSWLSGIGLGSWPEIFARYTPSPWSENFSYEAENDYLQFAAEMGAVGLLLAGWFVYLIVTRLKRGFSRLSSGTRSLEAALVAGAIVMAVVEFFDFDLQIPASAFTFAIILGLAVRLVVGDEKSVADDGTETAASHST